MCTGDGQRLISLSGYFFSCITAREFSLEWSQLGSQLRDGTIKVRKVLGAGGGWGIFSLHLGFLPQTENL